MVVAVAEESRGAQCARPWIEQAKPAHWSLIDPDHRVGDLYGMVNVPQAVWIDEDGRIVRPPEVAGSTDRFRSMDRTTRTIPAEDLAANLAARAGYFAAVRDWVLSGRYALSPDQVKQRSPHTTAETAEASAHFRLGLWLHRKGRAEEAAAEFEHASRLHPESWAIWRQAAELLTPGAASGRAFWQRVDSLSERPYYPTPDFAGG